MYFNGAFATMHSFNRDDGTHPNGPLLLADDGNIYGTTELGGENDIGTVFRITLNGNRTTLYDSVEAFFFPEVIQASSGDLVGTNAERQRRRLSPHARRRLPDAPHSSATRPSKAPLPSRRCRPATAFSTGSRNSADRTRGGTIYQLDLTGSFTTIHHFDVEHRLPARQRPDPEPGRTVLRNGRVGGDHGDGAITG